MRGLVLGLLLAFALPGFAQDYAREARWADEVVPGIVVGEAVRIEARHGRTFLGIYAPVAGARAGIVLAHGVGVHPDHGLIGVLRTRLADAGYSTLSIQMPVAASNARLEDYYPALFPDATDRLDRAAQWLQARVHRPVALLSHSMGAWMSNVYLDAAHGTTPYRAWIVLGLTGGYSWTMRQYAIPVLDLYGEHDLQPVRSAAWRRLLALNSGNGSRQERIAGADHHFTKHEADVTRVIDTFLREVLSP
jgi:hypothetical protein